MSFLHCEGGLRYKMKSVSARVPSRTAASTVERRILVSVSTGTTLAPHEHHLEARHATEKLSVTTRSARTRPDCPLDDKKAASGSQCRLRATYVVCGIRTILPNRGGNKRTQQHCGFLVRETTSLKYIALLSSGDQNVH